MKDLFPIPLLHEKLILTRNDLYDQIKARRALKSSSREGYTSYFDRPSMEGIEWSELKGRILNTAKTMFTSVIPEGKWRDSYSVQAWWNLYGSNNHHCWHAHSSSIFAGTYYVYMDEKSVPIEFKNPIESLIYAWHPKFGIKTRWEQNIKIYAKTGDILMWPAWLDHSVPEQKELSDNLRCTISFNIINQL